MHQDHIVDVVVGVDGKGRTAVPGIVGEDVTDVRQVELPDIRLGYAEDGLVVSVSRAQPSSVVRVCVCTDR